MRRPFFRFLLLCLLIATLPLQGYAAGGCCAHGAGAAPAMAHCGMVGMAGPMASPSGEPGCAMHAAHRHHHDGHGAASGFGASSVSSSCSSSCSSCCAAVFALPPALPVPAAAAPVRLVHAAPIAPVGGHIPSGPERPPRFFLA